MDNPSARRPRLLDAFCGAGGSAVGYARAGFEVIGVDNRHQPRFPFEFVRYDALAFIRKWGSEFDFIHASPPCQAYSPLRFLHPTKTYPDMIEETRDLLIRTGVPWIIENVETSPLLGRFTLCGTMFGLRTYRHRRFESPILLIPPRHPRHTVPISSHKRKASWDDGHFISVTGDVGRYIGSLAMGIDWMTGKELSQAIPPSYTEYIGAQLLSFLSSPQPQDLFRPSEVSRG